MRSIRDRVGAFLCFWTDWTLKQLPAFYGAFTAVIRGARPAGPAVCRPAGTRPAGIRPPAAGTRLLYVVGRPHV